MSSKQNRYGLSRYVPADVKRQLRQEAGFGCVICGLAIGQYEHIDPEFRDARAHDPARMAFLCLRCHGKVTLGQTSKDTVFSAKQSPKAKSLGYSFEAFDSSADHPTIVIGKMRAINCDTIIEIDGERVFWIAPPEHCGAPFSLNAVIKNKGGKDLAVIEKNEWKVNMLNWDVEVVGNKILVRSSREDIVLSMRVKPPSHFEIVRLSLYTRGIHFCHDGVNTYVEVEKHIQYVPGPMTVLGSRGALIVHKNWLAVGVSPSEVQFGPWDK